jgi:hypothetical protein
LDKTGKFPAENAEGRREYTDILHLNSYQNHWCISVSFLCKDELQPVPYSSTSAWLLLQSSGIEGIALAHVTGIKSFFEPEHPLAGGAMGE